MSKEHAGSKINWPLIGVGALLMVICLALSAWQLDREAQKLRWLEVSTQRAAHRYPIEQLDLARSDLGYTRVEVRGRVAEERDFLLDNRIRRGVAGYERLTPLRLEGADAWILVNRGWVAQGDDRDRLPALPAAPSPVQSLEGYLYALDPGWQLKHTAWGDQWPKRVQGLDQARIEQVLEGAVVAYQLRLDRPIDAGFEVGWPTVSMAPERHRAYALQWLLLALGIGILSVKAALRRGG